MRLVYRRLENAHQSGRWTDLGMHRQFTHSWFSRVQRELLHLGTDRLRRILSDVARVGVQLHSVHKRGRSRLRVRHVLRAVVNECTERTKVVFHRIIRHCNMVFYRVTQLINMPLPYLADMGNQMSGGAPREPHRVVFNPVEIQKLSASAENLGPSHACLWYLLMSTGIRLEAARLLKWAHIDKHFIKVHEKGNRWHYTILTETVSMWLERIRMSTPNNATTYVFTTTQSRRRNLPISQRQLRNRFYCIGAGIAGLDHCHPHTTRHTCAQRLWNAGNSVELISKFLGHTTTMVTNSYYLRIPVEDVVSAMHIPWYHNNNEMGSYSKTERNTHEADTTNKHIQQHPEAPC